MESIINYLEAGFILVTKGINLYKIHNGIIDSVMLVRTNEYMPIVNMSIINCGMLHDYLILVGNDKKIIYLNNTKIASFNQSCDYQVKFISCSKIMQSTTIPDMEKIMLKSGKFLRIPKNINGVTCTDENYCVKSIRYSDTFVSVYTEKGGQLKNIRLFSDDYNEHKIDRTSISAEIRSVNSENNEINHSLWITYKKNEPVEVVNIHQISPLHYRIETQNDVYVVTPTSTLIL